MIVIHWMKIQRITQGLASVLWKAQDTILFLQALPLWVSLNFPFIFEDCLTCQFSLLYVLVKMENKWRLNIMV